MMEKWIARSVEPEKRQDSDVVRKGRENQAGVEGGRRGRNGGGVRGNNSEILIGSETFDTEVGKSGGVGYEELAGDL